MNSALKGLQFGLYGANAGVPESSTRIPGVFVKNPLGNKLYYSISEVADLTHLQPYTLRAWEKEFSCLRPRRARGKNRAYREKDIGIILLIKELLYEERYTTQGVKQKLKNEPELLQQAAQDISALLERRSWEAPDEVGVPEQVAAEESPKVEPIEVLEIKIPPRGEENIGEELIVPKNEKKETSFENVASLKELIEGTKRELNEILRLF